MSVILTPGLVLGAGALANPEAARVLYTNLFRTGAVTVSSAQAAHPKELAYDGLTYDGWRPSAGGDQWIATQNAPVADADCMAIAAHTLAGCTLTPQASTDGVDWENLAAPFMPADNRPLVWEFDRQGTAYRRLLVENAPGPFSLGAIQCGLKLELFGDLQPGWRPPMLNERMEYTNVISQGGQILGRHVVRRGVEVQVESELVEYTWAREQWLAFIEAAERYAFFFWWAHAGKTEVVYGGLTGQHEASFSSPSRLTTRFRIAGINR